MSKKIKPTKRRPSEKLVEGARDYVLDAYDVAAGLLTTQERLNLIEALREDLDLRQRTIKHEQEDAREARRRKRSVA